MIDFNKMIDNHLERERKSKKIGRYYPSEVGYCLRKVFYSYKYPKEVKPDLLRIFEMGNIIHDFVVEVLESEKNSHVELLKSEFPFKEEVDDFLISGRIDNLILLKSDNKKILVEVKSTGDIGYVEGPKPHNVIQLQLYMHYLGIKNGILLYVGKKGLQSMVFNVEYDEEEAERIINRFRKLHRSLKEDNAPDPEGRMFDNMSWMCRFCEYEDRCYNETPEDVLS